MSDRIFSIEQLNQYIRSVFDAEELLHDIRITGEVSGFSLRGSHAYFTLKDELSQIQCVYFDFADSIADGDRIVVTGTPSYYVKGGRFSFRATRVENAGLGLLYQQFAELRGRLDREGLFDRKIPRPTSIRRIGVVTSPSGAVIHDIVNVVSRRDPSVDIVVYPVKVQGVGAAEEVAEGVRRLDAYRKVDAIIVARGGGSAEDLSAFNDEQLARTVADCKKFIVSAVGHETDFTLCDFCSDLRAPTPSAAAELLTEDTSARKSELLNRMLGLYRALYARYGDAEADCRNALYALRAYGAAAISAEQSVATRLMAAEYAVERKYAARRDAVRSALAHLDHINPAKFSAMATRVCLRRIRCVRSATLRSDNPCVRCCATER